jgi:hypothetical protein
MRGPRAEGRKVKASPVVRIVHLVRKVRDKVKASAVLTVVAIVAAADPVVIEAVIVVSGAKADGLLVEAVDRSTAPPPISNSKSSSPTVCISIIKLTPLWCECAIWIRVPRVNYAACTMRFVERFALPRMNGNINS